MKAIVCHKHGAPLDVLTVEDQSNPVPGRGQVVIDVKAAAITYVDALLVQGMYQYLPPLPFVPGTEVSGIVKSVGDSVERISAGDRVVTGLLSGGFAEQALAEAAQCRPLPADIDFGTILGVQYAYGTALNALQLKGQLQKGETLLVLGAAGGVGLAMIDLGKMMGARVIAAASTDEKLALCRAYGADETINYATGDLKKETKELTGGSGADVICDIVGGEYSEPALRAIAWHGRFLVIGFTAGIPKLPLNLVLLKCCRVIGVNTGGMLLKEPETSLNMMKQVDSLMADGKLNPRVSKRYALENTAQALDDFINRRIIGKVVIEP
ncbi:NADPH:quinone oxidoreductase family protein [bacterium]|nr:NADPH:quinone oxidoreductase family protein [bacterium]